jgi:hypothetical protein
MLQYFEFRSIQMVHNPTPSYNFSTGKGMSVNQPYAVSVPDETEYPKDRLGELWSTLKGEYHWLSVGERDWMFRKTSLTPVKVPANTKFIFSETTAQQSHPSAYIVHFERLPDFTLDFSNQLSSQSKGVLPEDFIPLIRPSPPMVPPRNPDFRLYVFAVSYEFKWGGDPAAFDEYMLNGRKACFRAYNENWCHLLLRLTRRN